MAHIRTIISSFIALVVFSSCSPTILVRHEGCCTQNHTTRTFVDENKQRFVHDVALNGKVYSALWQQNSGEFRALCYQAFNLATEIIKQKTEVPHEKPLAIITDIDETFLDNSPYAVKQALIGHEFDLDTWLDWTSRGEALAFPGSLDFYKYAASQNVTIFYITNRNENDKPGTVKNLKNLGFPFADEDHVIVMRETSDKEKRRKSILENYDVILYLGDNLTDFSEVFYKKSQQERNLKTDELSDEFGKLFIVLPNSGYGDWESAVPGINMKGSPEEKDKAILNSLRAY